MHEVCSFARDLFHAWITILLAGQNRTAEVDECEQRADRDARDFLIPSEKIELVYHSPPPTILRR